jgi:hypothetical protein
VFGGSNLDAPALAPGIDAAIVAANPEQPVIIDVGGDPDGARALARFASEIASFSANSWQPSSQPKRLVVALVNLRRPQTISLEQNLQMLADIAATARLQIDALVGNTHLQQLTSAQTILDSLDGLLAVSAAADLPIHCLSVPRSLKAELSAALASLKLPNALPLYPIERYVRTVWE